MLEVGNEGKYTIKEEEQKEGIQLSLPHVKRASFISSHFVYEVTLA